MIAPLSQAASNEPVPAVARLSKFTTQLIRRKARRLVRCRGFSPSDREDIEQELAISVWQATTAFNPARAHFDAFATTVVERAAANLARDRKALKRGHHYAHRSLGTWTSSSTDTPALSYEMAGDLNHDVRAVLHRLPSEVQEVADRLAYTSRRQVARDLGVSRRTVIQRIDLLRAALAAAGLQEKFRAGRANLAQTGKVTNRELQCIQP